MIRPFTFVTLMLACTSGAYLFVIKHRAASLDTRISSITGQIRSAEQRIRVLRAEWAVENDPSQLAALSKQFLKLKPMEPGQLTTISRLAELLPPPGNEIPRLPLPPPPPWAVTPPASTAAPATSGPADNLAAGPVASAAPVLAAPKPLSPPKAPVQLASAQDSQRPQHQAVRHIQHPYARQTPHRAFHYAYQPPAGAQVMAVTAERAPVRMVPRFTAAPPYRSQPARPESVFGSYGADLPPPRPVSQSGP